MSSWMLPVLASTALLASACVVDSEIPEDIELTDEELDAQQIKDPFPSTNKCEVPTEGISGGTRDGAWCCGTKTCDDKEVCGEYYGQSVKACVDCHYYECIPVYAPPGGFKPPYVPPNDFLYAP